MKLLKIKDSYMFKNPKGDNPYGSHWYLVYTPKGKTPYVKELTHLYKPDRNKMDDVHNGLLTKVRVTGFDVPSGMSSIKKDDYFGNPLTLEGIKNNTVECKVGNIRYRVIKR